MERCFKSKSGDPGFIATGDVKILCSKRTCGPNGKAEYWCGKCCNVPTTLQASPSVISTPTPIQVHAHGGLRSFELGMIVAFSAIVVILMVTTTICRWKKRRQWFSEVHKPSADNLEAGISDGDAPKKSDVFELEGTVLFKRCRSESMDSYDSQDHICQPTDDLTSGK